MIPETLIPHVAKAEPGSLVSAASKALASEYLALFQRGAEADLARADFARRVCALAGEKAIREEVARLNAERIARLKAKGTYVGGSPPTIHGMVIEELSRATGLHPRTFQHWLKNWNLLGAALGLQRDPDEKVFVSAQTIQKGHSALNSGTPFLTWVDGVLHPERKDLAEDPATDPRETARIFVHRLQRPFMDKRGHPRLRDPKWVQSFAKEVQRLVVAVNVPGWQIHFEPHEKHDRSRR